MEMTLLFLLMKYTRYTSHFIGLVHITDLVVITIWWSCPMHICMLQFSWLWWYAKFACYSCCIEWHWLVPCGSRFFSFLLSALQFRVFIHVHMSLAFVVLIICRSFSSWTGTHMPVMVKTCSFTTAKLVSKYFLLCSIRCRHFSILCNKNAQNWSLILIYNLSYTTAAVT